MDKTNGTAYNTSLIDTPVGQNNCADLKSGSGQYLKYCAWQITREGT